MSAKTRLLPALEPAAMSVLCLLQATAGLGVVKRLVQTAGGERIRTVDRWDTAQGQVTILLPVLDEYRRVGACLDGLRRQGQEVAEIIVVDGGSRDGTPDLVREHAAQDNRIRLITAPPVPPDWNGKAWGLQTGLAQSRMKTRWVLTIDADVRPHPHLVTSLLAHAARTGVVGLSVATAQELAGPVDGLIHPSMLSSLVYRTGIPGHATRHLQQVQANGQCMLLQRSALERIGGFAIVRHSPCEDVTLARSLAREGWAVGFYETADLVSTRMYDHWSEILINWPRSLSLRDQLDDQGTWAGLLTITLTEALPLPLSMLLAKRRRRGTAATVLGIINAVLIALRVGVLIGTARAYPGRPPTYWLSPIADGLTTACLWISALRRQHYWRGRPLPRRIR